MISSSTRESIRLAGDSRRLESLTIGGMTLFALIL